MMANCRTYNQCNWKTHTHTEKHCVLQRPWQVVNQYPCTFKHNPTVNHIHWTILLSQPSCLRSIPPQTMGRTLAAMHNSPDSTGLVHPHTKGCIPFIWSVPSWIICCVVTPKIWNASQMLKSSSAKLVQTSACEILAPKMYLMFDQSISSPVIVVSFIDNRSMIQSTVSCVAAAVNANTWADLGKMLLKVSISEKALQNASPL